MASPPSSSAPWRRVNPRMLLVPPVRELIRYLPVLLLAVVAGSVGGEPWWTYVLSGLGVVIGILRWVTTSYRITPTHVQVRRGFLNRRMLSVPRERIRSVDVEATLLHRLVGLAVVKVGTSASHGQDGLDFDGIAATDIAGLRAELLQGITLPAPPPSAVRGATPSGSAGVDPSGAMADAEAAGRDFSGWKWSWARFAPFTLTGVGALFAAAFFALQLQFFDGGLLVRLPIVRAGIDAASRIPTIELVIGAAFVLVVAASVIALVRYVLAYSGFAIWRTDATTLHVRHGLLRTRQVTLDERRLRGVSLNEPLSLRAVGGASVHAIMTGIGRDRAGLVVVEPAGPRADGMRVAGAVLGPLDEDADPLTCELQPHGIRAHRRRYTRAAVGVAVIAAAVLVAQLLGYLSPAVWIVFVGLVPAAALLAEDRWRGLGHALLRTRLVTRHGSLARKRIVLDTAGIIGFTVRRSFFQRRAGLATLIATTAAGRHRYSVPDVSVEEAWRIADDVLVRAPRPASETTGAQR
ncbi:PH domain-containing protein [Humibacter sp.]|uniref:PH domain-containing protein n=1 Tax=Humibacter sp. TaxID=1940291 RepID=UPI003F810065